MRDREAWGKRQRRGFGVTRGVRRMREVRSRTGQDSTAQQSTAERKDRDEARTARTARQAKARQGKSLWVCYVRIPPGDWIMVSVGG